MRFNELFSAVIALFAVSAAALPAADAHGDLVARDFVEKRGYGGYGDPGPSGKLVQPAGGYRTVFNGGNIPIVYECVDLWNLITRSINVFLINDRLGYNTTLAENLMPLREESGAQDNRIVANFRVPNDISIRQSGEDWQVQVIESQIDPGDMMSYIVERFQSAAPYIGLSFAG